MQNIIFYGLVVLFGVAAIAAVSPNNSKSTVKGLLIFGEAPHSYWEAFQDHMAPLAKPKITEEDNSPLINYLPDKPAPVELHNNQPYHLLNDVMQPPHLNESLSCVNSRSCYAADFQRMVAKTGNYRQMTNNYKREYPDSCSAPVQELVLNFYKASPVPLPVNHTGKSVSEQ